MRYYKKYRIPYGKYFLLGSIDMIQLNDVLQGERILKI